MTTIEQLEADIVELMHKHQLHMERNRRLKETGSEKYNEFLHGKSWGAYQSLAVILGKVRKLKDESINISNKNNG